MFKELQVNFGVEFTTETMKFNDGSTITFTDNKLENTDRIDERNLVYCQYLNLRESSIIDLCTLHLVNLRVLML